ncbi:MAG: alpha-L-fucosidase [Acidimicrobiales bacterium]
MFDPTWESVRTHAVPRWYDDAKLGVFLHWGLYSVPGWAPQVPDMPELLRTGGPKRMLRDNPYAEWYLNSMQIPGSPTQRHHRETYGEGFPYADFAPIFDDASAGADLDALAALCQGAGARYVVLTTKHHDGFALWPATAEHPVMGPYHARRDLVGDLSRAVRSRGMRMGLYYSGGYDWPYNGAVLTRPADALLAVPNSASYRAYATAHLRELIDRYRPSVLWNDIAWPSGGNLAGLLAHYYNTVEEGVINDRWAEPTVPRNRFTDALVIGAGEVAQALWRFIPDRRKQLVFAGAQHADFRTPEYAQFDRVVTKKWESTRGVGHSFGANRSERPEDIISAPALIRSFCDIVSKNGNLLIGVGPSPDGTVPEEQQVPLRGLGAWMSVNAEAIVGTRPWDVAQTMTSEGTGVRFTQRSGSVYAMLMGTPGTGTFSLRHVDATTVTGVRLLGADQPLEWSARAGELEVTLPGRLPVAAVHTLDLGPEARATVGPHPVA